jgi:signal transduction histidine kinase
MSVLTLMLYVIGTPVYFAQLTTLCANCLDEHLTAVKVQALHTLGVSITAYAAYWTAINLCFALVYCAMATFIFWRKPTDQVTLFASFSLMSLGASFPDIPNALVAVHPGWWLPVTLLDALGFPSFICFLFLFPNGRFVPEFTRWVAIGFAVLYVFNAFFPGSVLSFTHWSRLLILLVIILVFGSLVFAQLYRYRRISTPEERQQTKWVVFGATIALLGFLMLAFLPLAVLQLFFPIQSLSLLSSVFLISGVYLLLLLVPLAIAIAILRYRLWDIDLIINRTLVYGTLTVSIVGIYAAFVVSLGTLLNAEGNSVLSLLAASLMAVLFQPIREHLQRLVNRLMYGERDEPYRVISRLGQRLEATLTPDAVLSVIVETVAQALKLPYAAITLQQEQAHSIAISYGIAMGPLFHLPLLYQSEQVGELLLAPRSRGESFTPADHRLFADLARQVGVAAHAVQLTTDLQQSRERLVTAREEERRRLRRDLHDGLGPALASMTLKLDAARNLLTRDPLCRRCAAGRSQEANADSSGRYSSPRL